jgi:hypothetical protein
MADERRYRDDEAEEILDLAMLGLLGMGSGILTVNKLTLSKWAHDGEGQLEYVAGRVRELVAEQVSADG